MRKTSASSTSSTETGKRGIMETPSKSSHPPSKKSTVTVVSPSTSAGNTENLNEGNVRITSSNSKNDTNISNMVIITDEKWKVIVDKLSKLDMLDVMAEDVRVVKTKLNDIETSLTFAHQEIEDLKKENKLLRDQIVASEINGKLESDKHEQYSRRENVRITGVREVKDECTDTIVMNLSQKLGVAVQREDISVSHRVKSRKPSAPSSIICRFVIRNKKDELLLAARTKAKDVPDFKGISINEDLTELRSKMSWIARQSPRVKQVRSTNGILTLVLLEKDMNGRNKMLRIFNPSDLANFLDKPEKSILKDLGLISE